MRREVHWTTWDRQPWERLLLKEGPDGAVAEGEVRGTLGRLRVDARYRVVCDEAWRTREVRVQDAQGSFELRADGKGAWWRDGEALPELEGCRDVDLMVTPFTNTLPLRRLALPVGRTAEVRAAWVRWPQLDIVPARQRYTLLAPGRVRFEGLDSAFEAELQVDGDLLVVAYEGFWRRAGL